MQVAVASTSKVNLDDHDDFTYLCRICAVKTHNIIPLFGKDGDDQHLIEKINKYLPIKVCNDDLLPAGVCEQCSNAVLAWHELVECCLQADVSFQNRLALSQKHGLSQPTPGISSNPDTALNENGIKLKKEIMFLTLVNNVLTDYLKSNQMDDNEWVFVCQKCPKQPSFVNVSTLTKHLTLNHSQNLHNRELLQQFITTNITFNTILLTDSELAELDTEIKSTKFTKDVVCLYCSSSFSSTKRLIFHLSKHIDIGQNGDIVCCEENYDDTKLFEQHLRDRHAKQIPAHVCKSCGFSANDQLHLQQHIDAEHKETQRKEHKPSLISDTSQRSIPAVCPDCNKTYSNKYNMFIHMETHRKREEFPCSKCDKTYLNKGSLNKHTELVHEGKLPYPCSVCGESFPTRRARHVHFLLHTGETPHRCPRCGKAFRSKNSLRGHIEAHLDIRRYECSHCSKRFRKSTHLKNHLNTHKKKN
ncbi:unnamed protein product [Pieris macdunnoughi]|uniref:Zinc finger protein n=1 Tax=Pieris macdunnoughi TaxID=345717 RepID=A0A821T556_9NEOP|nr:unnamed protein product [Pieris macdunnoughi]